MITKKIKNTLKEWAILVVAILFVLFILGFVVAGIAEPFLKAWVFLKYVLMS